MKTSPPQILLDYFAAANDARIDDAAACFAADAWVHDESRDHKGIAAIREWIADTTLKFRPTVQIDHMESAEAGFAVAGTVSGNFPGSPIPLNYAFTLCGEKISHLTIQ